MAESKDFQLESASSRVGAVFVVGGGIAGIQAALDLAESGYRWIKYIRVSSVDPGSAPGEIDAVADVSPDPCP